MEENGIILPSEVEAFINAFKSIGGGALSEKAATDLTKAVKSTMINNKKSKVTIVLELDRTNDEMITIKGSSSVKLPTPTVSGGFFVNLQSYQIGRNRPNEQVLPFKKEELH